jgi:uncharacterized OsmC-like protein
MDRAALKELQAPARERYRQDPDSSRWALAAHGDFRDEGITCTVDTWAGPSRAGLHPGVGGDGSEACSGDMLLQALVACAGLTLRSVATAMDLHLGRVDVSATAMFDARGTLGMSRDVPVGLEDVVVTVDIETDADDQTLERLARSTERYCVVAQTLREQPRLVLRRRSP